MKVSITKYREEVTTVRRSVARLAVEIGGRDPAQTPWLVNEPTSDVVLINGAQAPAGSRGSPQPLRKGLPDLLTRLDEVADVVDLGKSNRSGKNALTTYSPRNALGHRYPVGLQLPAPSASHMTEEEEPVRYSLSTRRFTAIQEMEATELQYRMAVTRTIDIEI